MVACRKNTENLDGISIGAFEMAQFCAGYHRDKNRAITVLELPFMDVRNLEEEVAVSHAVYAHPAVAEEMAAMERAAADDLADAAIQPRRHRRAPRHDRGIRRACAFAPPAVLGELFAAVGGVPTSVTSSEAYQAMEGGTVDTVAFAPHAHLSFRTIDIADWWTENLNPGTVNCPVVVNIDAYEALTDEASCRPRRRGRRGDRAITSKTMPT